MPDDTPIGFGHAERGGQLALERLDFGPQDEALAVADAGDGRQHLVADRTVLRLEVEERHRRSNRHVAPGTAVLANDDLRRTPHREVVAQVRSLAWRAARRC